MHGNEIAGPLFLPHFLSCFASFLEKLLEHIF